MSKHHLTGKRIICQSRIPGYDLALCLRERVVIEVSPSCEWIKLSNDRGEGSWEKMSDVNIIEILGSVA